jgi:hypothetical protein
MLDISRSIHMPHTRTQSPSDNPGACPAPDCPHGSMPKYRTALYLVASLAVMTILAGCGNDEVSHPVSMETQVTVNELQSRNSSIVCPETKKKSDWVELYNPTDEDANLQGYFISDDPAIPKKVKLSGDVVVLANSFLVLWLDDTNDVTPLHYPFKLSGDGDFFILSNPNGYPIHKVTLPDDPTGGNTTLPDVSYGAYPDGSKNFGWCASPTLGRPNAADCAAATDAGT